MSDATKKPAESTIKTRMLRTRFAGIYKRPGGRYTARIRSGGYTLSKTFSNQDAARAWHRDTLADLESGRSVIVDRKVVDAAEAERIAKRKAGRTVDDLIDRFEKTRDCKVPAAHRRFFREKLGTELVGDLTAVRIRDVIDEQTAARAPATFNRYKAAISRLLNYALEIGWVDRNVVAGKALPPKKEDNRRDRIITPQEEQELLAACEAVDERLALAFALAMATGCRRGELLGLTWGDIDMRRGTIRLGHGVTKNKRARTLVIRGAALDRLKAFAKVRPIDRNAPVFESDVGTEFQVTKGFRAVADSLGMHDVVFHSCRHTFATRLARTSNVSLVMLRDALGHRSLAMVQRYSHEQVEDLAGAIDRMMESLS